jgi:hypothetical protein
MEHDALEELRVTARLREFSGIAEFEHDLGAVSAS